MHTETEEPITEKLNLENENLKSLVTLYETEIKALKEKILQLQSGMSTAGLDKDQEAYVEQLVA